MNPEDRPWCARSDPRMNRAVEARLREPNLTLYQCLIIGGFDFSVDDASAVDRENVTLTQRKNQLNRRLRAYRKRHARKSAYSSSNPSVSAPGPASGVQLPRTYLYAAPSTSVSALFSSVNSNQQSASIPLDNTTNLNEEEERKVSNDFDGMTSRLPIAAEFMPPFSSMPPQQTNRETRDASATYSFMAHHVPNSTARETNGSSSVATHSVQQNPPASLLVFPTLQSSTGFSIGPTASAGGVGSSAATTAFGNNFNGSTQMQPFPAAQPAPTFIDNTSVNVNGNINTNDVLRRRNTRFTPFSSNPSFQLPPTSATGTSIATVDPSTQYGTYDGGEGMAANSNNLILASTQPTDGFPNASWNINSFLSPGASRNPTSTNRSNLMPHNLQGNNSNNNIISNLFALGGNTQHPNAHNSPGGGGGGGGRVDPRQLQAIQFFQQQIGVLYERCMLNAGYSPEEVHVGSPAYRSFVALVSSGEWERIQALLSNSNRNINTDTAGQQQQQHYNSQR